MPIKKQKTNNNKHENQAILLMITNGKNGIILL